MGTTRTILVDNGSLNPAATLRLREIAWHLSSALGQLVEPVSVLHSDKINPAELDGLRAHTFENYAREAKAAGCESLRVIPLFIGPSLAITEFLPELAAKVGIKLEMRRTLWTAEDPKGLVELLHDNLISSGWKHGDGTVLLCDHGSPIRAVTAARNNLAERLRERLKLNETQLIACSMERREGPTYDFNEPMLADAVAQAHGEITVLMLFILPGRHAGAGGDVATICAQHAKPGTSWKLSPLIGEHSGVVQLLARSCSEA